MDLLNKFCKLWEAHTKVRFEFRLSQNPWASSDELRQKFWLGTGLTEDLKILRIGYREVCFC